MLKLISPVAARHQGSFVLEPYLGRWIMDLATRAWECSGWYLWSWRRGFVDTWRSFLWLTACVQGWIVTDCDDALEFGKYFRFILQGGREGNGVAQSCTLWDVGLCLYCSFFIIEIDFSNGKFWRRKKKPCALLDLLLSLDQKPVITYVSLYGLMHRLVLTAISIGSYSTNADGRWYSIEN